MHATCCREQQSSTCGQLGGKALELPSNTVRSASPCLSSTRHKAGPLPANFCSADHEWDGACRPSLKTAAEYHNFCAKDEPVHRYLVCRLLLEKKKIKDHSWAHIVFRILPSCVKLLV